VLKWDGSGITNNIKDALEGVTGIETTVNEKKGYVYSVYPSAPPPMAIEKGAGTPSL
jgi:hypothetical protein